MQVIWVSFSLLAENTVVCQVMSYIVLFDLMCSPTYIEGGLKRIACDVLEKDLVSTRLVLEEKQSKSI